MRKALLLMALLLAVPLKAEDDWDRQRQECVDLTKTDLHSSAACFARLSELARVAAVNAEADLAEEAEKQAQRKAAHRKVARTPSGLHAAHPGWSDGVCQAVSKGKVIYGMTKDQVRAAWGSPTNLSNVQCSGGRDYASWTYRS